MKKKISYIFCIFISFLLFKTGIHAGSLNVYASNTSVTVGSSVVITVKADSMAGKFSVQSSNGSVLSGGTSSSWIEGTVTYTFNANNPGTATVTVSPIDVANYDGSGFNSSRSVTINVNPKKVVVLSSDNTLSSLSIEGKELSPEFNSDTLEYSVELEPDTTKVNINASANHSGASIDGAGEREVSEGENNLEITVTAENGSSRTYKIKVTVKEYNPIKVKVDKGEYTVVRKRSQLTPPANYEETTVKIGDEEIPAYKSDITKYTLVGLKDKDGNQNLYIYKDGKYTLYQEFSFNKIVLYPIPLDKKDIPTGYKEATIKYNGKEIKAYKTKANSKYALIYGMNVETGKTSLYMYEASENTLQIYNQEIVKDLEATNDLYMKIIIGVSVFSVILIFIIILVLIKNNKKIKAKADEIKFEKIDYIEENKNT